MKKLIVHGTLLLVAVLPLRAWDVSGHIIVAKIAYDNTSPNARKKMDELGPKLTFATQANGHYVTHTYNGVSLAAWPDNVKHASKQQTDFAGHFGDWHFDDLGLDKDDPNPLEHPPKMSVKSGDALQGLNLALAVLRHQKTSDLIPNDAVALALLCHLVGDIHQPLHCTTHYSKDGDGSPESDAGGNAVKVTNFDDKYAELHQFWDTAYKMTFSAGTFKAGAPLSTFSTTPDSPKLVAAAHEIAGHQSTVDASLTGEYLVKWINETHKVGADTAYGKLGQDYSDNKVTLTKVYGDEAKTSAQRQMYAAGMRLAAILRDLYP